MSVVLLNAFGSERMLRTLNWLGLTLLFMIPEQIGRESRCVLAGSSNLETLHAAMNAQGSAFPAKILRHFIVLVLVLAALNTFFSSLKAY